MANTNLTLTATCAAMETAINAALALDSSSQQQLANLAPKIISMSCIKPELTVFFRLGDSVEVLHINENPVDAAIEGDASAWFQLATAEDKPSALINGDLTISGDSQLFIELGKIAENIDIDWEGYLARFIGDIPAHLIGKATRSASNLRQQAHKTITRSIDDMLHEELRLLPTRIEVETFYSRLRKLEMRLERLGAQFGKLQPGSKSPGNK